MSNAILTQSEIIEVSVASLSEHSKLSTFSPDMKKKEWASFVASVSKSGIRIPIVVTKGSRVIDGKHRLKAAKELGFESVHVIVEDIAEDGIPTFIRDCKLVKSELTKGQRASITIREHYETERSMAKARQGERTDLTFTPTGEEVISTDKILAEIAGVGKSTIGRLLPVYRKRPDLEQLVFEGKYSPNRAYTEMKRDEAPEVVEVDPIEAVAESVAQAQILDSKLPQIDDSKPLHEPNNRSIQMRKNSLSLSAEILREIKYMDGLQNEVRDGTRSQLLALMKSCAVALGKTSKSDGEADIMLLINELLNKAEGEN